MPKMDSPQISGVLEQGSPPTPTGTVVRGLHLTKRPREEGSPLATLGKRGRGENGDNISLTLQIPVPSARLTSSGGGGGGNRSPPAAPAPQARQPALPHHHHPHPPPLCESPGKTNQVPRNLSPSASSLLNSFAPFSGGGGDGGGGDGVEDGGVESAAKSGVIVASPSASASTPEALSGEAFPTARRKFQRPPCTPYAVARAATAVTAEVGPSLGATDPIFHAALLRLLHRRGGIACPEAPTWRWRGSSPARFEHWPRALHPSVMDLLACVSAGEERVVLTGCDMKKDACGEDEPSPTPQLQQQAQREATAWPAPRPRTPAKRGAAAPAAPARTPLARTPNATSLQGSTQAQTPLSALRRPGSACRSANRVRFSTHDMSVVDTPDPTRGGSEEGMVSALDGLESILSAAEKVRGIAASASCPGSGSAAAAAPAWVSCGRSGGGGDGVSCRLSPEGSAQDRHFEGYFDRFSSAGRPDVAGAADDDAAAAAAKEATDSEARGAEGEIRHAVVDEGAARLGQENEMEEEEEEEEEGPSVRGAEAGGSREAGAGEGEPDAPTVEARSVREDAVALAGVLEEIASSDSAPKEVALTGGWGPEHSNAAAFYAKEVALLCGAGAGGEAQVAPGVAGSHLRVRYLDVLSSLVRYNLKLLLNLCLCDIPEVTESVEACQEDDEDAPMHECDSDEGDSDCGDIFDASSPPTLTVVVPGRAALLREEVVPSSPYSTAAAATSAAAAATAAYELSVTPQAGRGCGCVTVLDGTGALEFNTEDVAALLTLALGRMHPFMPLAARLAAAAEGKSGSGDAVSDGDSDVLNGDRESLDGDVLDDEDGKNDGEEVDARVWAAVQKYAIECRAAAATAAAAEAAATAAAAATTAAAAATASAAASEAAAAAEASASDASRTDLFSSATPADERPGSAGEEETPGSVSGAATKAQEAAEAAAVAEESAAANAAAAAAAAAAAVALTASATSASSGDEGGGIARASPNGTGDLSEDSSTALTVDEAADLLEYVAAARFVAQLIAEPVVAAGIETGRWAGTERLAMQVRKLVEEEEEATLVAAAAAAAAAAGTGATSVAAAGAEVEAEGGAVGAGAADGVVVKAEVGAGAGVGAGVSICVATRRAGARRGGSLSNMLCLGALADVKELGTTMAQQARYAPALEAVLRGELRRALRRGQGSKKRRIRNRMQQGAPDVFSFPMITPCCCFVPAGAI